MHLPVCMQALVLMIKNIYDPLAKVGGIRMGEFAGGFTCAFSGFDHVLWSKLKTIIKY